MAPEVAPFAGVLLGYGYLMLYLAGHMMDLEEIELRRRTSRCYVPLGGLCSFLGLSSLALGTLILAATIWP